MRTLLESQLLSQSNHHLHYMTQKVSVFNTKIGMPTNNNSFIHLFLIHLKLNHTYIHK